jgi:hypothetical protein
MRIAVTDLDTQGGRDGPLLPANRAPRAAIDLHDDVAKGCLIGGHQRLRPRHVVQLGDLMWREWM